MVDPLEQTFPGLAGGNYAVTSPRSRRYHCIAWAAGDSANWWWRGSDTELEFWPPGVPRVETLDAFREAFASLGYLVCGSEEPESGFQKIALFANERGEPQQAARQLHDGRWTSKLGYLEDIEHALRDLEGQEYGTVVLVMRRPLQGPVANGASG